MATNPNPERLPENSTKAPEGKLMPEAMGKKFADFQANLGKQQADFEKLAPGGRKKTVVRGAAQAITQSPTAQAALLEQLRGALPRTPKKS